MNICYNVSPRTIENYASRLKPILRSSRYIPNNHYTLRWIWITECVSPHVQHVPALQWYLLSSLCIRCAILLRITLIYLHGLLPGNRFDLGLFFVLEFQIVFLSPHCVNRLDPPRGTGHRLLTAPIQFAAIFLIMILCKSILQINTDHIDAAIDWYQK